jgi:hypothetical protein
MMRVLTDFHHSSLLTATNLLFGERLHMMVYRPIGLEWFDEGFWAINDQRDTANQFLSLDQSLKPGDNTPPLNLTITRERDAVLGETPENGVYYVADPGGRTAHRACTLDWFKNNRFDYVIASIPAHVPLFERLIAQYQPHAKLIIQVGNNWDLSPYEGKNVLASTAQHMAAGVNAMFYHQEFDTHIFMQRICEPTKKIYSFVNILQRSGQGWNDFVELEKLLGDYEFRSYGGQCRDGNKNGPLELANAMHEAQFILHSKPGGDGFGHIIFNAYACGRPVIARPSQYAGMLAEQLLVPGTFINLDELGRGGVKNQVRRITADPDGLFHMGKRAAERFNAVVNYEKEAEEIGLWLSQL